MIYQTCTRRPLYLWQSGIRYVRGMQIHCGRITWSPGGPRVYLCRAYSCCLPAQPSNQAHHGLAPFLPVLTSPYIAWADAHSQDYDRHGLRNTFAGGPQTGCATVQLGLTENGPTPLLVWSVSGFWFLFSPDRCLYEPRPRRVPFCASTNPICPPARL